jgi:DNA-directed RNA polymerase subunit RPC12/RpoP
MIRVTCPTCSTSYDVPESAAGKSGACKKCGERVKVKEIAKPAAPIATRTQPPGPLAERPAYPIFIPSPRPGQLAVPDQKPAPVAVPDTKPCPFCAEDIKAAAVKCRHCNETLDPKMRAAEEATRRAVAPTAPVYMNAASGGQPERSGCLYIFAMFGFVFVVIAIIGAIAKP